MRFTALAEEPLRKHCHSCQVGACVWDSYCGGLETCSRGQLLRRSCWRRRPVIKERRGWKLSAVIITDWQCQGVYDRWHMARIPLPSFIICDEIKLRPVPYVETTTHSFRANPVSPKRSLLKINVGSVLSVRRSLCFRKTNSLVLYFPLESSMFFFLWQW